MCRKIKTLYNYDPAADEEEIRAASLQFVRKLSGFTRPSKANEEAFEAAIEAVSGIAGELLAKLKTSAAPRNREVEAAKARAQERFGRSAAEALG
jgi:hypothetical protein